MCSYYIGYVTASHNFEDEYVDVSLEQNFSRKLGILMKNISYFDYTKHEDLLILNKWIFVSFSS